MKKILLIATFLMLLGANAEAKQPAMEARFGVFYSNLSGYGEWVDCNYGYAWRPRHVAAHWRPYMMGRWAWTDYGWYWVSYEPFGWATYHYGRWIYDDYYGWIWVPDDVWGPAWVEWRYDNDYIGWCPLSPYAVFNVNIGIQYTRGWNAPVYYWNFVPYRNFTAARVNEYVQPVERSRRIFGSTRGVVNIRGDASRVINQGVDVDVVRTRGHVDVNRTDVIHSDRNVGDRMVRSGEREKIEVYRPRIDAPSGSERQGQRRDVGRNGAFDQPQHRNVQEESRGQRDIKPEERQQPQEQPRIQRGEPQGRSQRDVKPEMRQQPQEQPRMQRSEPQGRSQREMKPEVRQIPQGERRMEQPQSRQGVNRAEPVPQSRERMAAPRSERSKESRPQQSARPQSRGRRPG